MIVERLSAALLIGLISIPAAGQMASPAQPAQTKATRPANPPAENRIVAPQVVTVLHRLNGLKMFRLLLRSEQNFEAIANLDQAFKLMDDVHTNVTAGVALEDGQTIAAWLPEADVELPSAFSGTWVSTPALADPALPTPKVPEPRIPGPAVAGQFGFHGGMFASPDLTVIDSEGKKMAAQFVGVDGATGLSILKLKRKMAAPPPPLKSDDLVDVGEGVSLLGPEEAPSSRRYGVNIYVRIGYATGTISKVRQAPSGDVAQFKVRTPRVLSSANIGCVAVNATGEALGIIDAVEGTEASILPAALIQRAAKRVLARQASVPKPWLGVKGDPIISVQLTQLQQTGWEMWRASDLAQAHRGILLTSIVPDSPAASAALKAGDVILKVNDEYVQTAEDFSWLLDQAGPSSSVEFTVAKPERKAEELVTVVLSASPRRPPVPPRPTATTKTRWLVAQGIETIALRPLVAARLGSTAGLLVVYVQPATPAFEAGLQPGDVIETIDGRRALAATRPVAVAGVSPAPSTFEIVRQRQKLVIVVPKPAQKNQ